MINFKIFGIPICLAYLNVGWLPEGPGKRFDGPGIFCQQKCENLVIVVVVVVVCFHWWLLQRVYSVPLFHTRLILLSLSWTSRKEALLCQLLKSLDLQVRRLSIACKLVISCWSYITGCTAVRVTIHFNRWCEILPLTGPYPLIYYIKTKMCTCAYIHHILTFYFIWCK